MPVLELRRLGVPWPSEVIDRATLFRPLGVRAVPQLRASPCREPRALPVAATPERLSSSAWGLHLGSSTAQPTLQS